MENYRDLLKKYIETHDEKSLYQAEQFSKLSLKQNISPVEIIHVHNQATKELFPNLPKDFHYAMKFLLETMMSYGLAYQEFQSLREKQLELKSEISVAANMQQTLLSTVKPTIDGLDVGVISVPANQMNGDYYHFIKGEHGGKLGVAIADVIGKGIPAALAMSMIKYSMDSLPENSMSPQAILKNLNRVVERNVDPSMFITMFYGSYDMETETFSYSSAGHEPGFYYNTEKGMFREIETKGLVLGVDDKSTYEQFELKVEKGDKIVLLTDGVTECRHGERFIEREEVFQVIQQYDYLPAQEAVEQVYKHFERLQDFHLRDDFTLIMLSKNV
ncbi:PP2C family protein-serine/threonine phosphatase [Radiobacillus kanasensis]|uniref:PP2C family protein-serine/threonine phosphatase n=1 Tax=Radiobacillus kanasensis TaxID=2844358 RepID=UPI001E3E1E65|nr:PP2C family protein-serine/threonine phosphatase [Radiobacillus kanasensis]UFT99825.1 PP2C family protein-serine/threonine phosphatase [Radiobacillus kanasensis]